MSDLYDKVKEDEEEQLNNVGNGKKLIGSDHPGIPRPGQNTVYQDVHNRTRVNMSRRAAVGRLAFFGAVMSTLNSRLLGRQSVVGSSSNSDILPPNQFPPPSSDDLVRAVKIARAMRSGPLEVTRDATVAEFDHSGNITDILRKGTNAWVCTPGDENKIGDPPMSVDELGMQWFRDVLTGQQRPTNKAPGLCYMLCGATQHSNTDPSDRTSSAIPIGPHWMILWPFDPKHSGLPTTVRDAGAWIMFAGTPYAYLHICGTPWDGKEYSPEDDAVWTMQYSKRRSA
jgi:hypothetical protein